MPKNSYPNWSAKDTKHLDIEGGRYEDNTFSAADSGGFMVFSVLATADLAVRCRMMGTYTTYAKDGGTMSAIGVLFDGKLDRLSVPSSDVLLCITPGMTSDGFRGGPSIIWWRDKFWVPFRFTVPALQELVVSLGWPTEDESGLHFDVIYEINANDIPEFDFSNLTSDTDL